MGDLTVCEYTEPRQKRWVRQVGSFGNSKTLLFRIKLERTLEAYTSLCQWSLSSFTNVESTVHWLGLCGAQMRGDNLAMKGDKQSLLHLGN